MFTPYQKTFESARKSYRVELLFTHNKGDIGANNRINHNYNKILKSDWLSTALISALIGQLNRTVRVMPK